MRAASTHVQPEADRTKKLLMRKDEIKRLVGKVEQKGFTLVPLNLHYKGGLVKAEIALAKGKAQHDKRETEKKRDWEREHRPPDAPQGVEQVLNCPARASLWPKMRRCDGSDQTDASTPQTQEQIHGGSSPLARESTLLRGRTPRS